MLKRTEPSSLNAFSLCLSAVLLLIVTACGGGTQLSDATVAGDAGAGALDTAATLEQPVAGDPGTDVEQPAERERALAVTATPASPKRAIVLLGSIGTSSTRVHAARFDLAIVNMPIASTAATISSYVSDLKTRNPSLVLGQYVAINEIRATDTSLAAAADLNRWWLYNAAGAKLRYTRPDSYETNLTAWAPKDAQGRSWSVWRAEQDAAKFFQPQPKVDFVYTDTVVPQRVSADWKRVGSNQTWQDGTVQAATRVGFNAYWNKLKTLRPGLKVMGNVDPSWLASVEFKGTLDGALLNGMMGKSWSVETWGGWSAMMAQYRTALANTNASKQVVFLAYAEPTDYARMRYGLASAMLENGYFSLWANSGTQPAPWYDEYSAPIGTALDVPPTAAAGNGIWLRRYSNGMVLVNPGTASASYNVGLGYRRLTGTQDPAVNNGAVTTTVTLGPKQGLMLVKDTTTTPPPPPVAPVCKFEFPSGDTSGVYKPMRRGDEATNTDILASWAKANTGVGDVVFLGDSITGAWKFQTTLWNSLATGYSKVNFGVGGDTVQTIAYRLEAGLLNAMNPRSVVLMIGANNVSTTAPTPEITGRAIWNLASLVKCQKPNTRLILMGTLPRGSVGAPNPTVDPVLIAQVQRINAEIARLNLANAGKVAYLDIGSYYMSGTSLNQAMYIDQVHLSNLGYQEWARHLGPVLSQELAR